MNGFFAAEAAALGVVGALIGFVIGIGVAAWIGRVNFHAPVVPRFSVLPGLSREAARGVDFSGRTDRIACAECNPL